MKYYFNKTQAEFIASILDKFANENDGKTLPNDIAAIHAIHARNFAKYLRKPNDYKID